MNNDCGHNNMFNLVSAVAAKTAERRKLILFISANIFQAIITHKSREGVFLTV